MGYIFDALNRGGQQPKDSAKHADATSSPAGGLKFTGEQTPASENLSIEAPQAPQQPQAQPTPTLAAPAAPSVNISVPPMPKPAQLRVLKRSDDAVNCVAWHPSQKTIAVGADDGRVTLYDATKGRELRGAIQRTALARHTLRGCSFGCASHALKMSNEAG